MRKVLLYIAMSLDGYIARADLDVSWLNGDDSDPKNPGSYPSFYDAIDTVVLGWNTYHQIKRELSPEVWPYEGKKSYVVTHHPMASTDEITFTQENLPDLIERLKQLDGRDIWICGGASLARQLIEADLIDWFCVSIIPTILGDGIRLFPRMPREHKLKLIHTESYNGIVDLVYESRSACLP